MSHYFKNAKALLIGVSEFADRDISNLVSQIIWIDTFLIIEYQALLGESKLSRGRAKYEQG